MAAHPADLRLIVNCLTLRCKCFCHHLLSLHDDRQSAAIPLKALYLLALADLR